GGTSWSTPTLVSAPAKLAAFTPAVAVGAGGRVAVAYYDFSNPPAEQDVLPVNYELATTDGPGTNFVERKHLAGPFNIEAAAFAGGYFLGDYEGLAPAQGGTGFVPFFAHTNCTDTSCDAIGTPDGSPTGGPDPQ